MKKEIQAERERSAKREKLLEEKYHEEDELAQREKELNLEFEKQMWNQERISAESKEKQVILNNLEESLQELQEENEQSGSIQEELDAVRLAIMTMNQISEDIYKESAAHLNQKISDIFKPDHRRTLYQCISRCKHGSTYQYAEKAALPGTGEPRHDGADLFCTAYGGQ